MTSTDNNWPAAIGILRGALLGLALLNILVPLIGILLPSAAPDDGHSLWSVMATMITPVMAPLFITVILFDYIMSRIRAADAEGELRRLYTSIGRIELAVIAISLLFWVPYFAFLLP